MGGREVCDQVIECVVVFLNPEEQGLAEEGDRRNVSEVQSEHEENNVHCFLQGGYGLDNKYSRVVQSPSLRSGQGGVGVFLLYVELFQLQVSEVCLFEGSGDCVGANYSNFVDLIRHNLPGGEASDGGRGKGNLGHSSVLEGLLDKSQRAGVAPCGAD